MITDYRGFLFHNKTQAQWAFLLDLLDIDWEYTGERPEWLTHHDLAPTFFLPSRNTWLRADSPEDLAGYQGYLDYQEILDAQLDSSDLEADDEDGKPRHEDILLVAVSGIPDPALFQDDRIFEDDSGSMLLITDQGTDGPYLWTRCPDCGYVDAQFLGRAERLRCRHGWDKHKDYRYHDRYVVAGYRVARRAIRAKLPSRCSTCRQAVTPGNLIVPNRYTGGHVHWQHAGCWFGTPGPSITAEPEAVATSQILEPPPDQL